MMLRNMLLALGLAVGVAHAAEPSPAPLVGQEGGVTVPKRPGGKLLLLGIPARSLNDDFISYFFRKHEDARGEHMLRHGIVQQPTNDASLIEVLGGEAVAETMVSEIAAVLGQHLRTGDIFVMGGSCNIFYTRDKEGVMRTVCAIERGGEWYLEASPVGATSPQPGDKVFFRDAALDPESG